MSSSSWEVEASHFAERFQLFTPARVPLALTTLILVGVIVPERILFSRKAARGEPTPIELLETTS